MQAPRPGRRTHLCTNNLQVKVQSCYTRMGTPPKWVKVGVVCLRCQNYWPKQHPLL